VARIGTIISMTSDSQQQMTADMRVRHWEDVYCSKEECELSWHQDNPRCSQALITACSPPGGSVIDVGGGSSILGGRLADLGHDVTIVDISASAIERSKGRTGATHTKINWMVGDVLQQPRFDPCDVWHDRAVFHFLTHEEDQRAYVSCLQKTVRSSGHVVLGVFAMDGPAQCSGLPVERYDAAKIETVLGQAWTLESSEYELHTTPWGKTQLFLWVVARLR
jgi:2-polyprenyl-3-methyl-5-hydroxy-6-metoxy-1,4-benzoquinol methylase